MLFRFESKQDRRDTADELFDLASDARITRKAAEEDRSAVAKPMGLLETCLLHAAYRINPERIEVVPDPDYPSGEILSVRYRSRVRQCHVLRTQWLALEKLCV